MEKVTSQVGSIVEFFWYAPVTYVLLAAVLLWFAISSASLGLVEKWAADNKAEIGRLNMKPPFWRIIFISLFATCIFLGASYYQKSRVIEATRAGIVHFMVGSGWRTINFEKVRTNINSDYTNNLLLAVGTDDPTLTLEPLGSLSLKLHGVSLCAIKQAEISSAQLLARVANERRSTGSFTNLSFREIDEVLLKDNSQLLTIATLLDYPDSFKIYYYTGSSNISSVDVYLDLRLLAPGPLPFRGDKRCD